MEVLTFPGAMVCVACGQMVSQRSKIEGDSAVMACGTYNCELKDRLFRFRGSRVVVEEVEMEPA